MVTGLTQFELRRLRQKLINGNAFVDLGLPSGLFWATCNVGASSPEEAGSLYAWGESEGTTVSAVNN